MKELFWEKEEDLNKIDWIKKYNQTCEKWINETPDRISLLYSYFEINEHKLFVEEICRKIGVELSGTGLEIGCGPGILSNSVLKIYKNIDLIYLLEKVPKTYLLKKKIADYNKTSVKLISVIGDFNYLKLPNNSLDFVLDFDAIHHSENFELTFKEISRVLKPGGKLLCFDRGQPDSISKKQIEYLLNIEYSKSYKIENGINPNKKFTRRMNGEKEPYLKDWKMVGKKYNLNCEVYIFHRKSLKNFVRSAYGLLIPFAIKRLIQKGLNITTHYQLILNYFFINNIGGIKVFNLEHTPKSKKSPTGKMIFLYTKGY